MQIGAIYVDKKSGNPLVVLHDPDGKLIMPIWVGIPEITAITMAAKEQQPTRPSVYHLLMSVLTAAGVNIRDISIEANQEDQFKAWITLEAHQQLPESGAERIDVRPADALVLASLTGAPLFVLSDLFDVAESLSQQAIDQVPAPISEDDTQKFKAILEDIKPVSYTHLTLPTKRIV